MTDFSNPEQREEKTLLEIVAFQLFVYTQTTSTNPEESASDKAAQSRTSVEVWQSDAFLRSKFRAVANSFVGDLNEAGLKVSVKKVAATEQAISAMTIIPARKAYDFAKE